MTDLALTFALHFVLFGAGCIVLRLFGKPARWTPVLAGWACIAAYWIASIAGHLLQGAIPLTAGLHWNWLGKVCVVAAAAAILYLSPSLSRQEVGLTWQQRRGSFGPAVLMIVAMCALAWIDAAATGIARDLSPERLLFQGIMPGLDEEFVFRGLVLVFFVRAFGPGPVVAGARFGVAETMISLIFGAAHGLHIAHGALAVDWHTVAVTGALGAGLMWLRQRTGSLVIPVIAHNILNFGTSFI